MVKGGRRRQGDEPLPSALRPEPSAYRLAWGLVRFALMLVTAVALIVSLAAEGDGDGPSSPTRLVSVWVIAVVSLLTLGWDDLGRRRRNAVVAAGVERPRLLVDPLDTFLPVSGFAALGAIAAVTLDGHDAQRWLLTGLCVAAAVLGYVSYRARSLWWRAERARRRQARASRP